MKKKKKKKKKDFFFHFLVVKFSVHLNRRVFVMITFVFGTPYNMRY